MKMLMFLASEFHFKPYEKMLEAAGAGGDALSVTEAAVVFVHCEPQDEANPAGLETKAVKNIKWIAGKRGFKNVVLHSFTHLAEQSASPEFAQAFLEGAARRLENTGYAVWLTPFGWVCEWGIEVYGESLAKVFKAL